MFVKIVVVITVRETTFNINGVRGKKTKTKEKIENMTDRGELGFPKPTDRGSSALRALPQWPSAC
jgi:hypothetical protein